MKPGRINFFLIMLIGLVLAVGFFLIKNWLEIKTQTSDLVDKMIGVEHIRTYQRTKEELKDINGKLKERIKIFESER